MNSNMRRAIEDFPNQLRHPLTIISAKKLPRYDHYLVAGMGGSHLGADLLKMWRPELSITIHSDYGLPPKTQNPTSKTLVIASSYSGNTEETIDAYITASKKKLPRAVIAIGEKLLTLAKKDSVPYIQLPNWGIQPRSALGLSVRALLTIIGDKKTSVALAQLADILPMRAIEERGRALADKLQQSTPIVYTSTANRALGYIWKIKFNETSKIPAFCNVIPELNHNEMAGMATTKNFHCLMLTDTADDPRIQKRMKITSQIVKKSDVPVTIIPLLGTNNYEKTFFSLLLADWTSFYTAELSGVEADDIPMISEFKKSMAK